jgi:hypothetical protein
MTFPCCCGTPSCRLAAARRFASTVGGSTWSTTYPAMRSTSTSGMTWMMPWRRLLTWCSLPYAHSAYLTPWTRPSHCTRSRTTLIQSGRRTLMMHATSFRTTATVVERTWRDIPSTCYSCSMTPSAPSHDSVAVSMLMQGRSNRLSGRPCIWARSTVPCASS